MNVRTVTLTDLEQIATDSGTPFAVDADRRVAYLRRGQVRFVAPLDEVDAA